MNVEMQKGLRVCFAMVTIFFAVGLLVPAPESGAQEPLKEKVLVDEARLSFENFMKDPDLSWFRAHLKKVRGLIIVPGLYKGGFFLGGSGGKGVLLVKDERTGGWSQPSFYTLGGVSFGLQFGGEKAEVIMMVMTRKGLESLYSSSFKLGADASVAAGPVGTGAQRDVVADIISFARGKGAYVGFSLEGTDVKIDDDSNEAYYQRAVRPIDILLKKEVNNPGSARLREDIKRAAQ